MPTPSFVADLQTIYGLPSQAGFGSAVFYEWLECPENLEQMALKYYQYFVGNLWDRFGEAAWMSAWKAVYRRKTGDMHQIVAELQKIADPSAKSSVSMLFDAVDDGDAAKKALSAAYDDATVINLVIYALGDGAAMSGILVAGQRQTGEATFLVFLLD